MRGGFSWSRIGANPHFLLFLPLIFLVAIFLDLGGLWVLSDLSGVILCFPIGLEELVFLFTLGSSPLCEGTCRPPLFMRRSKPDDSWKNF